MGGKSRGQHPGVISAPSCPQTGSHLPWSQGGDAPLPGPQPMFKPVGKGSLVSAGCISGSEGAEAILLQMKPQGGGGWKSREDMSRTPPPNPQPSTPTYVPLYTILPLCPAPTRSPQWEGPGRVGRNPALDVEPWVLCPWPSHKHGLSWARGVGCHCQHISMLMMPQDTTE